MFPDGSDEVFGAAEELEELVCPKGPLKRDPSVGRSFGDGADEIFGIGMLFGEDLKICLLAQSPVLILEAAQLEELDFRPFEIEDFLLCANNLGEVSMCVALVDGVAQQLGREDSCSSSYGLDLGG